jgi:hypothetical protein
VEDVVFLVILGTSIFMHLQVPERQKGLQVGTRLSKKIKAPFNLDMTTVEIWTWPQ